MSSFLINIYNTLFSPYKLIENTKTSFFIPFYSFFIFLIINQSINIRSILFFSFISFGSVGFRSLFIKKINFNSYLSTCLILSFSFFNINSFIISIIWLFFLRIFLDIKFKAGIFLFLFIIYDILIVWWYI